MRCSLTTLAAGLALAALAGAGCRRSITAEPPAPALRFAPARLELGRGVEDEPMAGTVRVGNAGTAPLVVDGISASRFCTGRLETTVVPPGGTAALAVTCRSDLYGPLREGVDVRSNDPRLPTATLSITGEVEPRLAFDATSVELAMPYGESRTRTVRLRGTLAGQARPRLSEPAAADSELRALPGQPAGFEIRCLGRKVGVNAGNLAIATGLERPSAVAIPYACRVEGTLEVSPTNPFFNLKVSGDKAVRLTVRSRQPGFAVHAVQVLEGPFAARFAHAEDDATFHVDVTVKGEALPDDASTALGSLLIVSNDRSEPRREVALFASGRINKIAAPAP